jgi:NAD(P)-dependent dehydrogenase (short-subunit alcohol dehydrogenase family)
MADSRSLAGTTAFITGASAGLGAAMAMAFAGAGAQVVLAARRCAELDAVAAAVERAGGAALAVACDVADPASVAAARDAAVARFGAVDHLVNNAGTIEPIAPVLEGDPDLWVRTLQVNVIGALHACRAFMPPMLERGSGTVLNISSGAAHRAMEGWGAYCTSKAALLMFTRTLIADHGGQGVRIRSLVPGAVATAMQVRIRASGINEVSRIPPDELTPPDLPARVASYLCSPAAADIPDGEESIRDPALRARVGGLPERERW